MVTIDDAFRLLPLDEFELLPPAEKAARLEDALACLHELVKAARERRSANRMPLSALPGEA